MPNLALRVLVILLAVLASAGVARGQNYPFFVQPLSVDDLNVIAGALELSPEQRLEVLKAHSTYLDELEALQNGPMKRFMDKGISMVSTMQPWGGDFDIPPRRDLDQIVRDARAVFSAFGALDDDFFDSIAPLVSEEQLPRLELARAVRAVDRYRLIYLRVAGELNPGAGIHLIGYFIRDEVRATPEVVEVLLDHQERLLATTEGFERAVLSTIDAMLDKVDDMGLRDMEQQQMMMLFMDEALRDELIVWADEATRPIQLAAAAISAENQRAWRELEPLLEGESAQGMRRRVLRKGWPKLARSLFQLDSRFKRVLEHLPESDPRRADVLDGQERLQSGLRSLLAEYAPIIEKQRRYRSIRQFDSASTLEGADRIEAIMERRKRLEEQAGALLLVLEADMPDSDDGEKGQSVAGGGADGGSDGLMVVEATIDLPVDPLELERLQNLLQWIDAADSSMMLAEVLHDDYLSSCRTLSTQHEADLEAIAKDETKENWRDRRTARRAQNTSTIDALRAHEDVLFGDLDVSLESDADRKRLDQIRGAVERSRSRQAMAKNDWAMRGMPESTIDLTTLVLSLPSDKVDAATRAGVLEQLLAYDRRVSGTLEELQSVLDSVQLLESRMYGKEAAEQDADVQARIRSSWERRRASASELAGDLTTLNRDSSEQIADVMPDVMRDDLLDTYRRAAYPDLFKGESTIGSAFEEALAIETLGDDQRRRVQDLRMQHATTWSALTDELIELRSNGDVGMQTFPPSPQSMNLALRNEQLRFRRGQVAQRYLAELIVVLQPDQRAMVPSLQGSL